MLPKSSKSRSKILILGLAIMMNGCMKMCSPKEKQQAQQAYNNLPASQQAGIARIPVADTARMVGMANDYVKDKPKLKEQLQTLKKKYKLPDPKPAAAEAPKPKAKYQEAKTEVWKGSNR